MSDTKKKILVIAPVMPQESDVEGIARSLSFLDSQYELDFIDPLCKKETIANSAYYQLWEQEIEKQLTSYDAFMGFSFGGVILQQCFPLFTAVKKPIILFSTPTFKDEALEEKLGHVIRLCKDNLLKEALTYLYNLVFFPNKAPQETYEIYDHERAASRLIFGLQRVLDTDSTEILQYSSVEHLHLIGERSNLVNKDNVIAPKVGLLCTVPGASMRVLQDNLTFCKNLILEYLELRLC